MKLKSSKSMRLNSYRVWDIYRDTFQDCIELHPRTYSNASSNCGEGGNGPSPPLTDFTLPAQSVLIPPPSSSNANMDSPAYREV